MHYADLILPLPLPGIFTYSVPEKFQKEVSQGKRVLVQFGSRKIYSAIVKNIHNKKPAKYKTKAILSVLDKDALVLPVQLRFWDWLAGYYMCPEGEVMKAALPSGLRLESETKLIPNPEFRERDELGEKETFALRLVETKPFATIKELSTAAGDKPLYGVIRNLLERKALMAQESVKGSFKPKTETYISLHPSVYGEEIINQLLVKLVKAPMQLEILMTYLRLSDYPASGKPAREILKSSITEQTKGSQGPLKALLDKKILIETKYPVSRLIPAYGEQKEISMLNRFQEEALNSIKEQFKTKDVVLLNGITSGGKTEIYIHLIKEELAKGKQVLYLLPEIALTTQIIIRLKNIFGKNAGVYHSKFSDAERVEIWNRVLSDKSDSYKLILGVRSSLFLPFSDLGLVIVDEEHENTFKQFDPAPRYHARDAAVMLASMHGAKTLLGTATPSVESWYNSLSGKYGLVNLTKRYQEIELPEVIIADTREARKRKKMKSLFTPQLLEAVGEALELGEQVILFQNRRGYAPSIECSDCGWVPACKHCDVSMTYHKNMKQLVCHYCGASQKPHSVCPDCESGELLTRGFGTEKIEDEISVFFPGARVGRLDLDSVRKKKAHERIIGSFEEGKIDILAGTQMIAKGLDFGRVSLVGILNADNLLLFPDFRAHERSFQLMSQVSGRAGRKVKRGRVVIQTGFPDHPVIRNIIENNLERHFREQLAERRQFHYPPYVRLIRLIIRDKNRQVVEKAALSLASNLRARFGKRVLGPEYPMIGRIQNRYIMHILLKIEKGANLSRARSLIAAELSRLQSDPAFRSCQVCPDADPV